MKPAALPLLAVSVLIALGLGGCGVEQAVTRPEPTKFLKSTGTDMSERSARLPFEHAWLNPKVDMTKYKNIVIRPVTTAYLRGEKWEESKSPTIPNKRAYLKRCNALARYWTKSLDKAFSSPLCMFYKTQNTSQPGTLILEVALTEVRFDRPTPASEIPAAGGVISAVTGPPNCAFESRTRDAATGQLVTTAADRRGPEIKVLPNEKQSFAKPNEEICDEWSQQLMQRSNTEIYTTVKRSWFSF
ncbi:MAG: DUF3313 family protein [Verrucomicrobiota bacterium]